MKYEMPSCFGASGSVRAMRMPNFECWASDVQIFWPFTTHSSPSRTARVPQDGEVGAGAGLAEELAPDLLAGEQREEVALLLLLACRRAGSWPGPADADHVRRPPHPGGRQLLVDEDLVDRVGVEPPRLGQCGAT